MTSVAIGVLVQAEPERLRATAAAVAATTPHAHELIEIRDDNGGAACLNRLVASSDADVVVLLESGCLPAPRWLDHLLAALQSSAAIGLAGPSTNRAWNEQCVFPDAGASETARARTAADAERRFGSARRSLAPLYSLADFCYAVKREVFAAVGPADEGYGPGPCWEMDFNIRAARAGFDGVWTGAAFVWRAPFTARRAAEETARFDANKRRYQDKFCGARLRGEKHDYRQHCRGDACPNFAPRAAAPPPLPPDPRPLVSCIMPTYNRRAFVPLALRRFREQSYPRRELVIVDDGTDAIGDLVDGEPGVRYIRCERRLTIGAKRNLACAEARGEIVAHWDDDDWYSPDRLARQVAPIAREEADITGLDNRFMLQMPVGTFWTIDARLHRSMFVCDVHGGTLVFRRSIWTNGVRYPEINLGEDAVFVRSAVNRGRRLLRVDNEGVFVYVRHGTNAWRFDTGTFIDPAGWQETTPPAAFTPSSLAEYLAAART